MDSHYKLQGMNMNSMDAPGNSMEIHGIPRISMEVFHTGAVASHVVVVARHNFKLTFFQFLKSSVNAFLLALVQTIFMLGLPPTKLKAISSENSTAIINSCF